MSESKQKKTEQADKIVDLSTKTSRKEELVQISRREQRLRERLLAVEEDLIHDEKHAQAKRDNRKAKLTRKINKARCHQEAKLNRQDNSRLYRKSKLLYRLATPLFAIGRGIRGIYRKLRGRVEHHKAVTPHRSFYLTTHAQAVRQINISGYGRFVHEVWRMIWDNRRLYGKTLLALTCALLVIIGLNAQSNYIDMREALQEVGLGAFLEWVGMMTQAIITSMTVSDANRQMLAAVIVAMAWLVLIYIARHVYGGRNRQMKLRDAVYNAGGPILSLATILIVTLAQLLPLAIVLISYSAVTGAGYINQGIEIENMAAWCAIAAVGILTIYWMVTSLLSLITVTIPGIYPLRAYFETSIQVSGRRVKILLRILMMLLVLAFTWLVVLGPIVVIDAWWKPQSFPLVQLATTLLVAASLIWISVYLYMLYRRILDSPEQPVGTRGTRFVWPWLRKKRQAEITAKAKAKAEVKGGDGKLGA